MSFIQCKHRAEAEKVAESKPFCFISEDHRVYDEIEFSDDALFHTFDGKTANALMQIQAHLEMMECPSHEGNFDSLIRAAEDLRDIFRQAVKDLGFVNTNKKEPV